MSLQTMILLLRDGIRSARDREEGQGFVEYALMLSLVSVASVAILTLGGGDVSELLDAVENAFNGDG